MAIALVGVVQDSADSQTGWNNGGVEGELSYQGSASIGAKVGSGTTRFTHTGAQRNFSLGGANQDDHIIVILGSLTPGSLDTKANGGLGIFCGNDATTNFGEWYVDGGDTKPPTTLFLPYIIDPASDFDNASGSFSLAGNPAQLTATDTFGGRFDATSGIMGNFNNGLVDQITVGTGLRGTGAGGNIQEWIDSDEGTVGNRWGFLTTREGVVYFQGKMYFGGSSPYAFTDVDKVIIFPDAPVSETFYEIICENAGSSITFDGFTIQAPGTRKYALTHLSGSWSILNSTIDSARQINGGSGMVMTGSKISNSGEIFLGSGLDLSGGNLILNTTALTAVTVTSQQDFDLLENCDFQNNAIAITVDVAGSIELAANNINFAGNTVDVSYTGTGTLTLNNGGSSNVTLTNAPNGGTVFIPPTIRTVQFSINFNGSNPSDYEWRIGEKSATVGTLYDIELDGNENETSFSLSYSFPYTADTPAILQIIADGFEEEIFEFDLLNQNQVFTVNVDSDPNI